jgi:hypothetical protein
LYVAVNELKPNRRLASALRLVIVTVAVAGNPRSFEAIASAPAQADI